MGSRQRRRFSLAMTLLCGLTFLVVVAPLLSIVATAVTKGGPAIASVDFLTKPPAEPCSSLSGATCSYGGIAPALEGTLVLLALAALWAVPVGIGAAIFVVEYGGDRWSARLISGAADILSGIPSIVAGLFIFTYFHANDPQLAFSALSGSLALGVLMLPIVARASEEALRTVPNSQREAALSLGIAKWKSSLRITVIAALPGILTGILLAVARAAGEAAPLLLTAFGNDRGFLGLDQPSGALPLLIFNFANSPFQNWISLAWGAALVLLALVLTLSVVSRLVLGRMARRLRGEG